MSNENELNPSYTETGFITCPFDEVHRIEPARLAYHITKCMEQNPEKMKIMTQCLFNKCHIINNHEYDQHLKTCPDRPIEELIPVDEALSAENEAFQDIVTGQGPNNHGWLTEEPAVHMPAELPILRPFSGASKAVRKQKRRQQRVLFNDPGNVQETSGASSYYTTDEWLQETKEGESDLPAVTEISYKTELPGGSNTRDDSAKKNTPSSNVLQTTSVTGKNEESQKKNEGQHPKQSEPSSTATITSYPNKSANSNLSYAKVATKKNQSKISSHRDNSSDNKFVVQESNQKNDSRMEFTNLREVVSSTKGIEEKGKVNLATEELVNETANHLQNLHVIEKEVTASEKLPRVNQKKGKKKKTKFVPFNMD